MYAKLYDQFMEAEGAVEDKTLCRRAVKEVPVESQGASLLNDHIKFCGLLDSLGEQSFARDKDMTIRESLQRKNDSKSARKFFTVNNKMLIGLAKNDGGSKRNLSLEPTRSKRRSSKKRSGAAVPAATVRTIRPVLTLRLAVCVTRCTIGRRRTTTWKLAREGGCAYSHPTDSPAINTYVDARC